MRCCSITMYHTIYFVVCCLEKWRLNNNKMRSRVGSGKHSLTSSADIKISRHF
jgi:hypothetical protein